MNKLTSFCFYLVLLVCALGVGFGIYCVVTTPFSFPYLWVALTWILIWGIVAKYALKKKKTLATKTEVNES
ncbi:hypothetical protein [Anaerotignum sp.]|uniref:hypothetical protein n=1 Tax=Anaerotignum sp. TaxID=2039241 RepID=UPI0028B25F16|nr:hypothetical protein [Anaerotignum sp.]